MHMLTRLMSLVVFVCSAVTAAAADIQLSNFAGKPLVIVSGPLVSGDVQRFNAIASGLKTATVLLKSEGGSLYAGVEIGRTIRKRGFGTWVSSKDGRCASACGYAWLAGNPRLLDMASMIGFHAAYTLDHGKAQVNGIGNAIVGGYMRELGLSDRAIIYATTAGPNSMDWLSAADVKSIGLEVKYVIDSRTTTAVSQADSLPAQEIRSSKILGATRVKTIKVKPTKSWADDVFSPALR